MEKFDPEINEKVLENIVTTHKKRQGELLENLRKELDELKKEKKEIENYLQKHFDWKPGENRSIAFLNENYKNEYIDLTENLKQLLTKIFEFESKIKFKKDNQEN